MVWSINNQVLKKIKNAHNYFSEAKMTTLNRLFCETLFPKKSIWNPQITKIFEKLKWETWKWLISKVDADYFSLKDEIN